MSQGPYHLLSISLLLIFVYLMSVLGIRLRVYTRATHRRFWNLALLFFFLSTAILGLLLAVRVNFKLNLSWLEGAIQWHVDLGIGLVLVSIFHILWHFPYFRRLRFRYGEATPAIEPEDGVLERHLSWSSRQTRRLFILLGVLSILSQLVLLREFIKTFHGNELFIGVFLALWMILTAAGARAGSMFPGKIREASLWSAFLILGFVPLVIYVLQIAVTRYVFLPGYLPGILTSVTDIILLLSLFTLVSGFLFGYISRAVRERLSDESFYRYDSLGSLAGGLIFSLLLIIWLNNLQVLGLLFLFTSASLTWIFRFPAKISHRAILLTGAAALFGFLLLPGVPERIEEWSFSNEKVLVIDDTPFGNLIFTDKEGQVTGYLDRNPQISSYAPETSEESVHYTALQHPDPDRFLLMGGGLGEVGREVMKYQPARVDYCEADPRLIELGQKLIPAATVPEMNMIAMGGRRWLRENDTVSYDVILSMVGDPVTVGWNRFYSMEFYQLVKEHLAPGGVFGMQLSTSGNYINDPGMEEMSITYHTLRWTFENVLVVPGYASYFLASDSPLSMEFIQLLEQRGISTAYVHPDYLDMKSLRFDHDQIMARLNESVERINRDLRPSLFFATLSSLQSQWGKHILPVVGILGSLLFFIFLFSYRPAAMGMYVAGFSGSAIQILLIFVYQSRYGVAYMAAPLLIILFMGGIVAGTLLWKRIFSTPSHTMLAAMIGFMAVTALISSFLLSQEKLFAGTVSGQLLLAVLNIIPGMIVGLVFSMSLAISSLNIRGSGSNFGSIGKMYSADLTGAALGTVIPALFILPLIGIPNTFILLGIINAAAGLYLWSR